MCAAGTRSGTKRTRNADLAAEVDGLGHARSAPSAICCAWSVLCTMAIRNARDVAKAVRYARMAGEQAGAALAFEEAVANYERALEALEEVAEPHAGERAELLVLLGEAHNMLGGRERAQSAFEDATTLARGVPAPEQLARAAVGLVGWELGPDLNYGTADPVLTELHQEALAALAPEPSPERLR